MDFVCLAKDGVISQSTRNWLEPLWEKEQGDIKALEEINCHRLFLDDDADDDEDEEGLDHYEHHASITISGVFVPYFLDQNSVGHANRVWHASIATCLYLNGMYASKDFPSNATFQMLELGAGTALPSLYLGHILAQRKINPQPFIHITDGKHFRNIQQILLSICLQSSEVRDRIQFRVSPHNWGEGIGVGDDNESFFCNECSEPVSNRYDLVVVSDCIYNPDYHLALLESIAAMIKVPADDQVGGGRAIVSFSLHGNTKNETVWDFLDMAKNKYSPDRMWQLEAKPIDDLRIVDQSDGTFEIDYVGRGGWNMESTMKQLELWAANLDPQRWIAYIYELTWTKVEQ